MRLLLDVGNTQIYGGIVIDDHIVFRFRKSSKTGGSSDEIGLFFRQVLRENGLDPQSVKNIGICSVVPDSSHSLRNACLKYFQIEPYFLNVLAPINLTIDYPNPREIGADRIANAIAAVDLFPGLDKIIVDLGTATTFCVVDKEATYKGGVIMAGLKLCIEALEAKTAKLPSVEIIKPSQALGHTTVMGLQSGLYFGHLGAMKHIIAHLSQESFGHNKPMVIGTGGFSSLYEHEDLFDQSVPDLVLNGLNRAMDAATG